MMGSDDDDADEDEKIIHEVNVPGFWMAEYPTTQDLWQAVMGRESPSYFQGDCRPVERVSWYDAAAFCNALNALFEYPGKAKYFVDEECSQALDIERANSVKYPNSISIYTVPNHYGFRLPSEAEWEFAASTVLGNKSNELRYAGSNVLDEVGWYDENSHGQTQPVGLKLSNQLGLYDLSGNVREWCEDQWHENYLGAPTDASAWVDQEADSTRVLRGGSWNRAAQNCRSSNRLDNRPANRSNYLGFRLVSSSPPDDFKI